MLGAIILLGLGGLALGWFLFTTWPVFSIVMLLAVWLGGAYNGNKGAWAAFLLAFIPLALVQYYVDDQEKKAIAAKKAAAVAEGKRLQEEARTRRAEEQAARDAADAERKAKRDAERLRQAEEWSRQSAAREAQQRANYLRAAQHAATNPDAGYIYLLRGNSGFVKIGKTAKEQGLHKRAKARDMAIIAYGMARDHHAAEKAIHRHFKAQRQGTYELFKVDEATAIAVLRQHCSNIVLR